MALSFEQYHQLQNQARNLLNEVMQKSDYEQYQPIKHFLNEFLGAYDYNRERFYTMNSLATILDESEDLAAFKDLDLRFVAANRSLLNALSFKDVSEIIGKTDIDLFGDKDYVHQYQEDDRKAQKLKAGEFIEREEPFEMADGRQGYIYTKKFPVFDNQGRLIGTANISRDITARKQHEQQLEQLRADLEKTVERRTSELEQELRERQRVEQELRTSKLFLSNIINSLDDSFFVKDSKLRLVELNDAACRLIGKTREELLGKTDHEIYNQQQADVFREHDFKVLFSKGSITCEETITWQGELRIISTKKSYYKDQLTGKEYITGVSRDITDYKQVQNEALFQHEALQAANEELMQNNEELQTLNNHLNETSEQLKESQQKFRNFIEFSTDGIIMTNESGKIIEWNKMMEEITHLKSSDVLGLKQWEVFESKLDLMLLNTYREFEDGFKMLLEQGSASWKKKTFEQTLTLSFNVEKIVELVLFPIQTSGGYIVGTICRDMTEQRKAEREKFYRSAYIRTLSLRQKYSL